MKTVIFGCGKIAPRIIKGFEKVQGNELVGCAARDPEKARQFASQYGLKEYGTYDDFLDREDIDAIFVATYNLNHYELVTRCLNHKKHVICEKPMPLTVEECDGMFKAARENNVLLMEALKSVFLPINHKIKQMIEDKVIGDVHHMEASFVRNGNHPSEHWINDTRCGVLKDLGNYCVGTLNFLMGNSKPVIEYKYKNNTDSVSDASAELCLNHNGIKAHVLVSHEYDGDSSLKIFGTRGYIVVYDFWKTGTGYYIVDNKRYEINEEFINDFHYETQHFSDCVNNGLLESPIMSYEASRNTIETNS